MGIVVAVVMLLGLIALNKKPVYTTDVAKRGKSAIGFILAVAGALVLAGVWNAFIYGAENLGSFWGWAALVSGALMIAASFILLFEIDSARSELFSRYRLLRVAVVVALGACFLLYAITLIQLNLGMPIIR